MCARFGFLLYIHHEDPSISAVFLLVSDGGPLSDDS